MDISFTNSKYSGNLKKTTSSAVIYPLKTLLLHVLICLSVSLLLSFIFSGKLQFVNSDFLKQLFFAVIFFLMGISHIIFFPTWIEFINNVSLKVSLIYSFAFAITIGLTVFLYFFLSDTHQSQYSLVAACSFLLPLIIGISWTCFISINPIIKIKPWVVPSQKITFQNKTNLANSFVIKFNLKMYYFDETTSEYDVIVAGGFRLGKIFHEFLIENDIGDEKIQQLDYQLKPYGWLFFIKKFSGLKKLDPGLTFLDNHIKENDIIIIERVNIT